MATLFASHVLRMKEWCVKVCFDHSPRQPYDSETLQNDQSTGEAVYFPVVQEASSDGLGNMGG